MEYLKLSVKRIEEKKCRREEVKGWRNRIKISKGIFEVAGWRNKIKITKGIFEVEGWRNRIMISKGLF